MADTFHWPDDSEFEALDLDPPSPQASARPGESEPRRGAADPLSPKASAIPADGRRTSEDSQVALTAHVVSDPDDDFPVESKALIVPIRSGPHKVEIQPVEEEDAWFPSEDDADGGTVGGPAGASARHATSSDPHPRDKKVQSAEAWQELRSRVSAVDTNRKLAGIARWALPALGLVVVIESGWMLAGLVGGPKPATTATTPVVTPAATPVVTPSSATVNSPARSTPAAAAPGSPAAAAPAGGGKTPAVVSANQAQANQRPAVAPIAPSIAPALALANRPAPEATPAPAVAAAPAAPGAVLISLPFQVQVYEQGRFVGIIDRGPLPLSPGVHTLRLVNESVGFNVTQAVTIAPTKTTRVDVPTPTARVQLNAVPWAEVLIDGKSVGETPLGNVALSIGPHTFVFRNPKYRDQTRTIVVSGQGPNRISVDLGQ